MRQEAEVLEDHRPVIAPRVAELPARHRRARHAIDVDFSRGRLDQAGETPDERGLAAARQAHHHEGLTGLDVEGDALNGSRVSEIGYAAVPTGSRRSSDARRSRRPSKDREQ